MAKKNELVLTLTAFLEKEGAQDIKVVPGGRHNKLQFAINGKTQFFVLSGTPSDHRSILNARSQLRRQIHERAE